LTSEDVDKLIAVRKVRNEQQPEVDDEVVSQVVVTPTKTAADLSQAAGASAEITIEELLRRVQRIEEHLGIADN
jgi:hypothetical protein